MYLFKREDRNIPVKAILIVYIINSIRNQIYRKKNEEDTHSLLKPEMKPSLHDFIAIFFINLKCVRKRHMFTE